jgi:hypothetical protein
VPKMRKTERSKIMVSNLECVGVILAIKLIFGEQFCAKNEKNREVKNHGFKIRMCG